MLSIAHSPEIAFSFFFAALYLVLIQGLRDISTQLNADGHVLRIRGVNKTEIMWMFDRLLIQFECDVEAHFGAGNEDLAVQAFYKWHDDAAAAIATIDIRVARRFLKTRRRFEFGSGNYTPRAQFMRKCGNPAKQYLRRLKRQVNEGELSLQSKTGVN